MNESTALGSAGPGLPNGLTAPSAFPLSAAPPMLKPTMSAPPPLTKLLRENSCSCSRPVMLTHPPLPSRLRPAESQSKFSDRSRSDRDDHSSPYESGPHSGSSSSTTSQQ